MCINELKADGLINKQSRYIVKERESEGSLVNDFSVVKSLTLVAVHF